MEPTIDSLTNGHPEWANGVADKFSFGVTRLRVQDGDWLSLPGSGVTAVVSGNNVGKSTLLRQLVTHIGSEPGNPLGGPSLLSDVEISREGGVEDLISWLAGHASRTTSGQTVGFTRPGASFLAVSDVNTYWTSSKLTATRQAAAPGGAG